MESRRDLFWPGMVLLLVGGALVFFLAPHIKAEDPAAYGFLRGIWSTQSWYAATLVLGTLFVFAGFGAIVYAELGKQEQSEICLLDYLCDEQPPMDRELFLVPLKYQGLVDTLSKLGVKLAFIGVTVPHYYLVSVLVRGPGGRLLFTVNIQGNRQWRSDLLFALSQTKLLLVE